VTWFAVPAVVSCLAICKANLCDLDFLHGVIGPVEDRIFSKDKHLYLPTAWVSLGKITAAVWIATERPEQGKEIVSFLRPPFGQEFEDLSPQIDLIVHRI
jgi:hypothetical protein